MDFTFKCPHCQHEITEKDFAQGEQILSHLKETFKKQEELYKSEIKNSLVKEMLQSEQLRLSKALLEQKAELGALKQRELNELINTINQQKTLLETANLNLKKVVAEQVNEINVINNNKLSSLNQEKFQLQAKIENSDLNFRKVLAEKENVFNLNKQQELNKLNELINSQKSQLATAQVNLEKNLILKENELLIKQKETLDKKEQEIRTLHEQVEDLKLKNALNKVIQNKIKGETFEHDVEGELRKTFEPNDIISKITSSEQKADYLQEIRQDNKIIGKIVYEIKNAEWNNNWEKKLIEDMAKQGSKYGILVATSFNSKYLGVPFRRSDSNPNIYLCDADSFYFVGQIISSLIKAEFKLESQKDTTAYDEKIKSFYNWRDVQLPKLNKLFEDSFSRISSAESSITKQVDEIRIAREKIYKNWLHNIKDFLETFHF